MKYRSHLYRMNPLATYRPKRVPSIATILSATLVASLVALYWVGKIYNP